MNNTTFVLGQAACSSCFIPWLTVGGWQYNSFTGSPMTVCHPMTKRQWVTHCFISLPGSLINHVLSHDQQGVSETTSFLCQSVSSIVSHPMTNRVWVTVLYLLTRQSHQSCLIPWPTESEWHCFMSLPSSLINHFSSHDQQKVSDTALCLCQAASSIMSHREWVTPVLYVFARQSHQSCLIESEWHCFISLPGSLINHVSSHDQ